MLPPSQATPRTPPQQVPYEQDPYQSRPYKAFSDATGHALYITSSCSEAGGICKYIWYNDLFNESFVGFGPVVLLYAHTSLDLQLFIRHMVRHLDLTIAELVTGLVIFDSVLRCHKLCCASVLCVRLLFMTCLTLAIKTLDDEDLTTRDIACMLQDSGFNLDPKHLGRMESFILKQLDYRLMREPAVFHNYTYQLGKLCDKMAK